MRTRSRRRKGGMRTRSRRRKGGMRAKNRRKKRGMRARSRGRKGGMRARSRERKGGMRARSRRRKGEILYFYFIHQNTFHTSFTACNLNLNHNCNLFTFFQEVDDCSSSELIRHF